VTSLKMARQAALAALLRSRRVSGQAGLLEALHAKGFEATQATVSRDLDELGAVKVRGDDGRLVYALPEPPAAAGVDERELRQVLALSLSAVVPSGNLVVVHTPPGHANVLASTLDRAGLPGLAGTVAGDDTVLLVCTERTSGRAMARQLSTLAAQAGADAGAAPPSTPTRNGDQPDQPNPPQRGGEPPRAGWTEEQGRKPAREAVGPAARWSEPRAGWTEERRGAPRRRGATREASARSGSGHRSVSTKEHS
jgi:transcriptional regulator of arginine metabolism